MIFGMLKDIKEGESRVICTPVEIASIVAAGHPEEVQAILDRKCIAITAEDSHRCGSPGDHFPVYQLH